jgi:transposase
MTWERAESAAPALTVAIARRFYLEGKSKVEIAAELGVSRFKVARLLDAAREVDSSAWRFCSRARSISTCPHGSRTGSACSMRSS